MLGATRRERWIANTLAGLAEVAVLRGHVGQGRWHCSLTRASAMRSRDDALGVADIERRLRELANERC